MSSAQATIVGSYSYELVALSILIAIAASYAALDLAGRVTSARGRARLLWLNGGALAMGLGIWSMHYIGMLALQLPVPVSYNWPTVALSLLAAVHASGVALYVVSRSKMGIFRASVGSIFMGSGIAGMHYIGMAAMRMPANCRYSPALVALSTIVAVVISFIALWLTFRFPRRNVNRWLEKVSERTCDGYGESPSCITLEWLPPVLLQRSWPRESLAYAVRRVLRSGWLESSWSRSWFSGSPS